MAAAITRITPGRGRAGDSITVAGSGFASAAGRNAVTVDGLPATVTAESATSITVTVPAGIADDRHVDVTVENASDGTSATHRWWSKASLATLRALRLPITVHGPAEEAVGATAEVPTNVAHARDWERVISLLELLPFDLLTAKGRTVARGTNGLVAVSPGTTGQRYTRDTGSTGGSWRSRAVDSFSWGRQVAAAQNTEQVMCANGADTLTTSQGEAHVVAQACKLAVITITCRRGTPSGNGITRVRVFVNGTAQFDSDNLASVDRPDVWAGDTWAGYPWLTLAAGDRVTVGITKNGTTTEMNVFAHAVVV